ncbi:MAG: hypothetical protein C4575_01645 [Desulforudis sp.]|nr:MAG: hypothetical protein C4575_01645 [Desulforudis sp.]
MDSQFLSLLIMAMIFDILTFGILPLQAPGSKSLCQIFRSFRTKLYPDQRFFLSRLGVQKTRKKTYLSLRGQYWDLVGVGVKNRHLISRENW